MNRAPAKPNLIDIRLELGRWSRAEARSNSRRLRDRVLSDLAGEPFDESKVRRDARGRPTSPLLPEVCWSPSSCEGATGLAFAESCRVGFDLERIDPDVLHPIEGRGPSASGRIDSGLLRLTLSDRELELWRRRPEPELFFQIWTRKEAVLKCFGLGLHVDLRSVETGEPSTSWMRAKAAGLTCFVRSIELDSRLAAAVACTECRDVQKRSWLIQSCAR